MVLEIINSLSHPESSEGSYNLRKRFFAREAQNDRVYSNNNNKKVECVLAYVSRIYSTFLTYNHKINYWYDYSW